MLIHKLQKKGGNANIRLREESPICIAFRPVLLEIQFDNPLMATNDAAFLLPSLSSNDENTSLTINGKSEETATQDENGDVSSDDNTRQMTGGGEQNRG